MSMHFKRILYGGDYNPNQWTKDIWQEDMRIFKDAHINTATINVFSWAKIQPSEHEYNFDELDEIVDMLSKENYDIVFATSTAALPGWMVRKYPEVMFTDYEGRQHKFGGRHNACPNSFVFKHYARELAYKLAERYADNPHVTCWHVSNEYGNECFCENCQKAFRVWLKDKYKTIDALNRAWNMEFWGHTVYDWDDVVPPNALSDGIGSEKTAFAGISIDYRRFYSDSQLACFKMERDAIKSVKPDAFVTTNLMGTFKGLDYFKWAKEMDAVSWDNYPSYDTPWSSIAMTHDLMRGLKDEPFMLMEQTPSQQNWQKYNSLKRPGQMRAQSYQTLAHGADTIQFFQLRRSVGGCEKFHGAVIAHAGSENTRVFREVAQLGAELESFGDRTLGSRNEAEVGLIFDWDNYWALEYTSGPSEDLKYVDQIHQYYQYFYKKNIGVDMIPVDADFSKYKIVVAPVLYMVKDGMKEALENPGYEKEGIRLNSIPINGGYAFWIEDIRQHRAAYESLYELREELRDRNQLLKLEYQKEKERKQAEEKNRLYDLMQKQTAEQFQQIAGYVDQLEQCTDHREYHRLLGKILIVGSYLKRRKNLTLSALEGKELKEEELIQSLRESCSNLVFCEIQGQYYIETGKETLPAQLVLRAYDFFEQIVEQEEEKEWFLALQLSEKGGNDEIL